jgi:hypothetical protein
MPSFNAGANLQFVPYPAYSVLLFVFVKQSTACPY